MTETGGGSGSIAVKTLLKNPEIIGKAVGFKDLTKMHGDWIHQMVYGKGDYTLQAHRGSYKSSCLAVAIAMMMVIYPKRNIIFLRKTDDDVAEMMRMVAKILKSEMFQNLYDSDIACFEYKYRIEGIETDSRLETVATLAKRLTWYYEIPKENRLYDHADFEGLYDRLRHQRILRELGADEEL